MFRRLQFAPVLVALVVLSGCEPEPEPRVAWSPDGALLAIISGTELHVTDESGSFMTTVADDVTQAVWLPGSRELLIVRAVAAKSWAAVQAALTPDQLTEVRAIARATLAELQAHEGPMDEFEPEAVEALGAGLLDALLFYLQAEHAEEMKMLVGSKWQEMETTETTVFHLQRVRISGKNAPEKGPVMLRWPAVIHLAPPATGQLLAFTSPLADFRGGFTLHTVSLQQPGTPRRVAAHTGRFPAFSADGRELVYCSSAGPGDVELGQLVRQRIAGEDGRLLGEFETPTTLALVVFDRDARVRLLPDGRFLFSSIRQHLPVAARDRSHRAELFLLDTDAQQKPAVRPVLGDGATEQLAQYFVNWFEPSPDGRRVALVDDGGGVAVVTLPTGEYEEVVGAAAGIEEPEILPAWRSPDELCVARKAEDDGAGEVVLCRWTEGERVCERISGDWPDVLVRGLVGAGSGAQSATTQPTPAPATQSGDS